jgi:hypothetical protein
MSAHEPVTLVAVVEMVPGHIADGAAYEDAALALLGQHGGTLRQRLRSTDESGTEVQLISFAARSGLESFLADPDRQALRDQLGDGAPSTRVIEVSELPAS